MSGIGTIGKNVIKEVGGELFEKGVKEGAEEAAEKAAKSAIGKELQKELIPSGKVGKLAEDVVEIGAQATHAPGVVVRQGEKSAAEMIAAGKSTAPRRTPLESAEAKVAEKARKLESSIREAVEKGEQKGLAGAELEQFVTDNGKVWGARRDLQWAQMDLGEQLIKQGDVDKGVDLLLKAAAEGRALGQERLTKDIMETVAKTGERLIKGGHMEQGRLLLKDAATHYTEIGLKDGNMWVTPLNKAFDCHFLAGDAAGAIALAGKIQGRWATAAAGAMRTAKVFGADSPAGKNCLHVAEKLLQESKAFEGKSFQSVWNDFVAGKISPFDLRPW